MELTEIFNKELHDKSIKIWNDENIATLTVILAKKIYAALMEKSCEVDDSEKLPLALKIGSYRTKHCGISIDELHLIHIGIYQHCQLLSYFKIEDQNEKSEKISEYASSIFSKFWDLDDKTSKTLSQMTNSVILEIFKNGVNLDYSTEIQVFNNDVMSINQYYLILKRVLNNNKLANNLSVLEAICLTQSLITTVAEKK
ncbi:MAG: hypothetical protein ACI4V7_08370 [Succinivibrionaceae bacterium]